MVMISFAVYVYVILTIWTADSDGVNPRVCIEEKKPGPCLGYFPRYYFDISVGQCMPFIFGGCEGNSNNFRTLSECKYVCTGIKANPTCKLEKVVGSCKANEQRYYYDSGDGKCKAFTYGGCDGNANNFKTPQDCLLNCPYRTIHSPCTMEEDKGPCHGILPRFYYDMMNDRCALFPYGGCEGNENNFKTEEACRQQCPYRKHQSRCYMEKMSGPCLGYFPRYYFDAYSGSCKEFLYSGCEGNDNNFESMEDCEMACPGFTRNAICTLYSTPDGSPDPGPCLAVIPRFYYDSVDRKCKQFVYGGCGGGKNNFATEQECRENCAGAGPRN